MQPYVPVSNCVVVLFLAVLPRLYEAKLNSPLQKALSPMVWCRQALDHPSPDMETAKRSLIHRLELTMSGTYTSISFNNPSSHTYTGNHTYTLIW